MGCLSAPSPRFYFPPRLDPETPRPLAPAPQPAPGNPGPLTSGSAGTAPPAPGMLRGRRRRRRLQWGPGAGRCRCVPASRRLTQRAKLGWKPPGEGGTERARRRGRGAGGGRGRSRAGGRRACVTRALPPSLEDVLSAASGAAGAQEPYPVAAGSPGYRSAALRLPRLHIPRPARAWPGASPPRARAAESRGRRCGGREAGETGAERRRAPPEPGRSLRPAPRPCRARPGRPEPR